MKNTKYCWLYYSPADYPFLRTKLNSLAEQGYELAKPADGTCYLGKFQPTDRSELRYDVEPRAFCTAEELQMMVELRAAQGWEPICTVNGMNIYSSMPCHQVSTFESKEEEKRRLRPLLLPQLFLCLASVCFPFLWDIFHDVWYLDYFTLFIHLFGPLAAASGLFVILSTLLHFKHPINIRLRTIALTLVRLWWMLLPISIVLTLVPIPWAAGVLFGGVLLWLLFRVNALSFAGCVLFFSLVIHSLLPTEGFSSDSGMAWQNTLSDIVTAEQLDQNPTDFLSAEYHKTGTFLTYQSTYSEKWSDLRIESIHYTCLTEALARGVEADLHEHYPSYTVSREKNVVLALWTSADIDTEQLSSISQSILTNEK